VVFGVCGIERTQFALYVVGYGVFTTQPVKQGDFLLEYCGDVMDPCDGDAVDDQTCVYYFNIKSDMYWYVCIFCIV